MNAKKKNDLNVFELFLMMTRVRTGENYISFSNSWELVDYIPFLLHLIYKNSLIVLGLFEFIEKMNSMVIEVYYVLSNWLKDDEFLDWRELHLGS